MDARRNGILLACRLTPGYRQARVRGMGCQPEIRAALVVATLLLTGFAPPRCPAQDVAAAPVPQSLRWKWSVGQSFQSVSTHQTESVAEVNKRTIKMTLHLTLHMDWRVEQVDDDQVATITQSITRLAIDMNMPGAGAIAYDTQAGKPTSATKSMAAGLDPLIKKPVQVKLTPRGEFREVEWSSELREALGKLKSDSRIADLLSEEGLTRAWRHAAPILPEQPVRAGDSWELEEPLKTPLGPMRLTSKFMIGQAVERDGQSLQRILVDAQLEQTPRLPPGDASERSGGRAELKSHEQSGWLLFDVDLGRPVESRITQKLVTEKPYREFVTRVTTTSTSTSRFSSPEAAPGKDAD